MGEIAAGLDLAAVRLVLLGTIADSASGAAS
jgi:hypothetical protein